MNTTPQNFTRDEILELLGEVGEILNKNGVEAYIYVVGGTAMSLEYDSRRITRDVDAALRHGGTQFWDAVTAVAQRHGITPDWVNSDAVAFMPREEDPGSHEFVFPGLTVAIASPEYLIAMKLRSLRERDMDDLEVLFNRMKITTPAQAAAIHNRLFDGSNIGYFDPREAEYAAQRVFDRAAAQGRKIGR